jgi:hypothetical protein
MRAAAVVEVEIVADSGASFRGAGVGPQVDHFVFYGSPEALHEDVIAPGALAIYYRQCIGKANVTRGMPILISRAASTLMKSVDVNWLP